jgi:hypothetical protein
LKRKTHVPSFTPSQIPFKIQTYNKPESWTAVEVGLDEPSIS